MGKYLDILESMKKGSVKESGESYSLEDFIRVFGNERKALEEILNGYDSIEQVEDEIEMSRERRDRPDEVLRYTIHGHGFGRKTLETCLELLKSKYRNFFR